METRMTTAVRNAGDSGVGREWKRRWLEGFSIQKKMETTRVDLKIMAEFNTGAKKQDGG